MKKSYLNSERNSAVLLKPSMTIHLLLMALLCFTEKSFVKKSIFLGSPLNSKKGYSQAIL
jgi:hypothetical protein